MRGAPPLPNSGDADQVVQILFQRAGTYKIYWDALPLGNGASRIRADIQRYALDRTIAFEGRIENATGHGRSSR